jgi:hypothetical protein
MWMHLKNTIHEGAKKFIPTKTTKKHSRKPWVSPILEQKIKLKKRLHRRTRKMEDNNWRRDTMMSEKQFRESFARNITSSWKTS